MVEEGQEGDRGMMALALGLGRGRALAAVAATVLVCLACLATLAVWLAGSRLVFPNPHPHYCPRPSGWIRLAARNRLGLLAPLFLWSSVL